jgi:hypothetical protein
MPLAPATALRLAGVPGHLAEAVADGAARVEVEAWAYVPMPAPASAVAVAPER